MGVEVVILDNLSTGKRENINPKAQLVLCNLHNAKVDFLSKYCKDVDTIFHLASKTVVQESIENPQEYHTNKTHKTFRLFQI